MRTSVRQSPGPTPPWMPPAESRSRGDWLERLGLLALARPWLVSAVALLVTLVAILTLRAAVAASQLVGDWMKPIAEEPEQRFVVSFQIRDEEGRPVAGVELGTKSQFFGTTTETGNLRVTLQARQDQLLPLEVRCPPGYAEPDSPYALRLASRRRVRGVQAIQFDVRCTRQVQENPARSTILPGR